MPGEGDHASLRKQIKPDKGDFWQSQTVSYIVEVLARNGRAPANIKME